jgi:hypothetical protein
MRVDSAVDSGKYKGRYNRTLKQLQAHAEHQENVLKHTQELIDTQHELQAVSLLARTGSSHSVSKCFCSYFC